MERRVRESESTPWCGAGALLEGLGGSSSDEQNTEILDFRSLKHRDFRAAWLLLREETMNFKVSVLKRILNLHFSQFV